MPTRFELALVLPVLAFALAFFVVPMGRLAIVGAGGPDGVLAYASVLTDPRHGAVMLATLALSAAVTATTLAIATLVALFLARHRFPGRSALVSMLAFPLAFPGVVIGFLEQPPT